MQMKHNGEQTDPFEMPYKTRSWRVPCMPKNLTR